MGSYLFFVSINNENYINTSDGRTTPFSLHINKIFENIKYLKLLYLCVNISSPIPLTLERIWSHYVSIARLVVLHPSLSWVARVTSWTPWLKIYPSCGRSSSWFVPFILPSIINFPIHLFLLTWVQSILDMLRV